VVEAGWDVSTLRVPVAEVFAPLLPSMRFKGAEGGRSSAKSHHFAGRAVTMSIEYPGLRVCCIREVQRSLKRSSKQTIEDKLDQFKLRGMFGANKQEITTPGNGVMIFQGMQDHTADSVKSIEGFDVYWVEEADKLSRRSLDLLTPTARSTPRTVLPQPEIWFSWNKRYPTDPVDVHFRELPPELGRCVHATYRDNPWFPPELAAEVEWTRRRDPEKYAHVWEGGYLHRSASRVFNNWSVQEFVVPDGVTWYWGADWGFSVDPSVLVGCFIIGRTLYVRFEAWKVGCEIDDTPALFDRANPDDEGFARKWTITADSARSDTIAYMRRHGYPRISPARKGAGSVEDGIEFLKNYDIVVHPDCVHVADELTHYSYKVDKITEQVLPTLEDAKNHTIDSLRYAVEDVRWAVQGDAEATASEVSRRYDGGISQPTAFAPVAAEDVGQYAVQTADGHAYDGGLS
jgi:phage terminase large subunit